ncbi:MAG TPA: cupin, partial [Burkholderiaceae bacterium]
EVVYLLDGAITLILDDGKALREVLLEGRGAVVVRRGVWHTAKVHKPSRALHATLGAGTVHRPV